MISIYVSLDSNNSIGSDHGCVDFPKEICEYTRKTLNGKTIIVGRKHSEKVADLLPDSAFLLLKDKGDTEFSTTKRAFVAEDFESLMTFFFEEQDIVVVGGEEVFRSSEPYIDLIYVNKFEGEFKNSTALFPEDFNWKEFDLVFEKINENDDRIIHKIYARKEQ